MVGKPRDQVLFLCHSAWSMKGGIQSFNRRVIRSLRRIGVDRTSIVIHDRSPDDGAFLGGGGSFLTALRYFLDNIRASDRLLLGHINYLPFAILFKLFKPRGTVILFAHGVEVWGTPPYRPVRFYEPWILSHVVNRIAIVSDYSRTQMARSFGLSDGKFTLFPNAVDLDPAAAPSPAGKRNVLVVSRLAASEGEKNVDKVVRAFAAIAGSVPDARLVIVGDGELRTDLEALAAASGIGDRVDFLGFVDPDVLDRAYREAAVFALPSSKEGFGIVYLEAWLHGVPVIASRFGAGGEVVTDGTDGFVVDPQDIDAISEAMRQLLTDPSLRAQFARNGLSKVEQNYSGQAFDARLENLCA